MCTKFIEEKDPTAHFVNDNLKTKYEIGDELKFHDASQNEDSHLWSMAGPNVAISSTESSFSYKPTNAGYFIVNLTAYSKSKKKSHTVSHTYKIDAPPLCVIGTWTKVNCSVTSSLEYKEDRAGILREFDCFGQNSREIHFLWTDQPDNIMDWSYTSYIVAGQSQPLPNMEEFSFSCNSNS